jgi:hypothetical protein
VLVSRTGHLTIANENEAFPVSAGLAVGKLFCYDFKACQLYKE